MGRGFRTQTLTLTYFFLMSLILASCQPGATTVSEPSLPSTASVAGFPLAGKWSGVAENGTYHMDAIIEFKQTCSIDELCGHYNLLSIPCAGSYTLESVDNGTYVFTSGDYIGNCATSQDSFSISSDGTLQYISRGDFGETSGSLSPIKSIPVIYDDDGSPDGTLALMYLLSDPRVELKAVNISYGEANPSTYIQHIGALLDSFGVTNIPLGAGKPSPLGGDNEFPNWMRNNADNFWNQPIPKTNTSYPVQDAAELMVAVLNNSPEPVTIFISGPCTNLAEALRLDPGIKTHIQAVFIMGGALYTQGNLTDLVSDAENSVAEWNIYADPLAADEVFQSGLDIYLIPLDATNQVTVSHADTTVWRTGGNAAQFAANLYDQQIAGVNRESFYYWDAMTAEIMINPALCNFTDLHVEVITTNGAQDGQTRVLALEQPNVKACLQPDAVNLVNTLNSIFAASN